MKKLIIAFAAACIAFTAPAHAESVSESVTVKFDDLNLASDKGQALLDTRIEKAARAVCGMDDKRTGTRIASQDSQRCFSQAKRQVAKQVATLIDQRQRGG